MSGLWSFLKSGFRSLFWDGIREGLIDLRGVGWGVRLLALLALAAVLATLAATLLFDGGWVPAKLVAFDAGFEEPRPLAIPLVALWLVSLVYAVGWGYLMAGAARCSPVLFLVIGALYGLNLLVLAPTASFSPLAHAGLLLVVAVLGIGGYILLRRVGRRSWLGLVEAGCWVGLTLVFVAGAWLGADNSAQVASSLCSSVGTVYIAAAVYWAYLSLSVVDLGMAVGRWTVTGVRLLLPAPPARWLILTFTLLKPVAVLGLVLLVELGALAFDMLISAALAVVCLGLLMFRRYSASASYVLLAASIAVTVASCGLELAFGGGDFQSVVLSGLGLAGPAVSFVVLTLWDVASSGARFANRDGNRMPREGRLLLYSGAIMLAAMATLFYISAADPHFVDLANNTLVAGLGFLGLPYLLHSIWRRRERLIGPPVEEAEGWARLQAVSGRAWAAVVMAVAAPACCLVLGLLAAAARTG